MDKIDEYKIVSELTDSQIESLVVHSTTDPVLAKWTTDSVRFASPESVKHWLNSNPQYIVLTNLDGDLLGIAWLQEKPLPFKSNSAIPAEEIGKYKLTSGIRLYGSARGKGLGIWFYTMLFDRFTSTYVWARISADNTPSKRLHEKLMFKQVTSPDTENKIILVRHSIDNSVQ